MLAIIEVEMHIPDQTTLIVQDQEVAPIIIEVPGVLRPTIIIDVQDLLHIPIDQNLPITEVDPTVMVHDPETIREPEIILAHLEVVTEVMLQEVEVLAEVVVRDPEEAAGLQVVVEEEDKNIS